MAAITALINTNEAPLDASLVQAIMSASTCQPLNTRLRVEGCVGLAIASHAPEIDVAVGGPAASVWAVLDGRLDDRERLVADLARADGQSGVGQLSDSALLVRAYSAWGDDCAARLIGDFSCCLWDAANRRLLCARDHFGVKPLYYARVGSALVVSSVLRCVRQHPAISRNLRHEAIGDFLLFGVCAEPSQTAFLDVARVPPAHRLVYSLQRDDVRVSRYWTLEPGELLRYSDPRDYIDQFSGLFRLAVADRVHTGAVGVLMSGGLDSSSVATCAAEIMGGAAANCLHAFTVVYDTHDKDEERHYSSLVAATLGIPISHVAADRYLPFERWEGDGLPPEPSLEALTAIMFDVLDLAARHGSAVLTGDGGDPLLLPASVSDQIGRVPASALVTDIVRAWRLGMRPPFGIRSRLVDWFGESEEVPGWLGSDLVKVFDARARRHEIQNNRNADRTARRAARNEVTDPWWTSTFESFDPGVTRRSVELRYPFFDVRLASFVLRLPSFPWCLNKHVLREAARGRLPEAVRVRSKTPFVGNSWGAAGQWSSHRALDLLETTSEMETFVDVGKFRAMVNGDSLLTNETLSAWAAISLAMWLRCDALAGAPSGTV